MDTRQLLGTTPRGVVAYELRPPVGPACRSQHPAHGTQRSSHGGTSSSGGNGSFYCGPRASQIARAGPWSSSRSDPPPAPVAKRLSSRVETYMPEPHKVFDEVVVMVKSGNGGNGEIVPADRGRYVTNHKYKPGGSQSKTIWLPASDPGDGADGGDVVLVCDPGVDSLLHLHGKGAGGKGAGRAGGGGGSAAAAATFAAPDGSNANPNTGSGGPKKNRDIKKARTPALEIPVPPGTVVKRRGTGALLGELLQPGQRLTVARGGPGGHGVVAPSRQQRQSRIGRAERDARAKGVEVVEVEDDGWRVDSRGGPGQQMTLTLLLRVVADVGLVGFPNAGKSSLLKTLTRASPTIAPYPFTTLMPNLGVLSAGGGATKAVLADLPGLIEGAHKGRGLGRNFLRHLRRTRALLHVVDASAPDPATDYYAVREELRMYNPDYCARPHVVALNKTDLLLPQQHENAPHAELVAAIREAARRQAAEHSEHAYDGPVPQAPVVIVQCSAATGEGLKELAAALQRAIGASYISEPDIVRRAPDTLEATRGGPVATAAATVATTETTETTGAAAATAASPSGRPPPPPASWDDKGAWEAAAGGAAPTRGSGAAVIGGSDGWGGGAGFDDAAEELGDGELEMFTQQCRELGLMDEQGNFTGAAAAAVDAQTEQSFLDEEHQPGAGDGGGDDDEWVELSSLDEQTLAAVLEELERGGAGEGEEGLDLARDFYLSPDGGDGDGGQDGVRVGVSAPTATAVGGSSGRGGSAQVVSREEVEEAEEEEDEEGLVQMAPADDPDARLVGLSLEELLAMEKDW